MSVIAVKITKEEIKNLKNNMKSKKHTFDGFKISYLNAEDAKANSLKYKFEYRGDETCLFVNTYWDGWGPLFCLKGDHYGALMQIKKETKNNDYIERQNAFIEYAELNLHLIISY